LKKPTIVTRLEEDPGIAWLKQRCKPVIHFIFGSFVFSNVCRCFPHLSRDARPSGPSRTHR
jgi:hypothetical protein